MSDQTETEDWHARFESKDLDLKGVDPEDRSSERTWYESRSAFGDRGYVRSLLGVSDGDLAVDIEGALPANGNRDEQRRASLRRSVFDELRAAGELECEIETDERHWRLRATLPPQTPFKRLHDLHDRLDDLAAFVDEGVRPEWLGPETRPSSADENEDLGRATDSDEPARGDRGGAAPEDGELEAIGRDPSEPETAGPAIDATSVEDVRVETTEDGARAAIELDRRLDPEIAANMTRRFARAVRARRDLVVRPASEGVEESQSGPTVLRLTARAGPLTDGSGSTPGGPADHLRDFFDRLQRFREHGWATTDVLSGDESTAKFDPRPDRTGSRDVSPSGSRTEDHAQTRVGGPLDPSPSSTAAPTSEPSTASSDDPDEVVLDLDRPSSPPPDAGTGLQPGNYTDQRLLRDDATTSLVDVVLRHPGYAEEQMAHNLSILLDVEFHEAREIVRTAPRIIAWGVSRRRGLKFERVIEGAGGAVVLVEPDSLSESSE